MIYILDENLKIVDILRKYNFAQYNNRFRDIGAFKINAQLVDENIYILDETKQYYVLFDFDEYVFGQVTKVKQSGEGDNDKEIVIEGKLSKYILTKRVINGTINYKGKTFGLVKEIIDSNIVSSSNEKRNLPIEISCDEEYLTSVCSDITKQITGGYVWEEVEKLLTQDNLGIDFVPNIITDSNTTNIDKWYLTINAGVDRTKTNKYGNNPVIFSQQLSNIASVDYERDVEEYTNYAYVAGEGEEENRKWYEINRTDKDASGWNRKELWIDARDVQSENEDGTILSETEYEKLIKERANEKFSESDVQESYEATLTEKNAQYTYGVDYNLGDWCTITDINLNKELDVQITEITVTVQGTRKIVDVGFTYGLIKKDPIKQTQQNTININKTENNVRYLENITKPFTKAFSFLKDATGKIIGMAIGKVAELEGVLDINYSTLFRKPVKGKVYGLGELTRIRANDDFNNYTESGCFAVTSTSDASTIKNMPIQVSGRLIVSSSTGGYDGNETTWNYIEQRFIPLNYGVPSVHSYVRYIAQDGKETFTYREWVNESLKAYPVGSIYIRYDHTSPASLFGGTWERISGRFLWAVGASGTIGNTGGASSVDLHHQHIGTFGYDGNFYYAQNIYGTVIVSTPTSGAGYALTGGSSSKATQVRMAYTGNALSSSQSIMPPYIQVSVWRRTA